MSKKKPINESFTEFPQQDSALAGRSNMGPFAALFNRFTKIKKKKGRPALPVPKSGDTASPMVPGAEADTWGVIESHKHSIQLPRVEATRRGRYKDFERMDDYPEISSAFDIYSDDATQEDIRGNLFKIETDDALLRKEAERFIENVRLDKYIWDITRNVVKYGDAFMENIISMKNPKLGILKVKPLNPNYIYRVEDRAGNLEKYYQEIPRPGDPLGGGGESEVLDKSRSIELNKLQITHFRRRTSDPNFYPYGKGVASAAIRTWRSLRLMEDAMLIYRLQRAPERRVFKIDVGNMPQSKSEAFMERIKAKFKKEKFYDSATGTVNERYNPMSVDEDFFVLNRNGKGTEIDVLPGAQNLGDIDDVKYWRDKVLAALKIPKDFIVEKDKSPERKANLSQLDVKFSKAVSRVQRDIELGIEDLLTLHLLLRGFSKKSTRQIKIKLCPPSDMNEKRRLELDEKKLSIVGMLQGLNLFPDDYIYKNYFDMSEGEISDIKEQMKAQREEQAAADAAQQEAAMGGGAEAMPPGAEDAAAGSEPTGQS